MPHSLCLTRQCLGFMTRIECEIRPLAGENGLWTLLCAAGMAGAQPTAIKAQGPFHGSRKAESVLEAIVRSCVTRATTRPRTRPSGACTCRPSCAG